MRLNHLNNPITEKLSKTDKKNKINNFKTKTVNKKNHLLRLNPNR